jgi:acyl carrier protein
LRWFRSYFADVPEQSAVIGPETTFNQLDVDPLDYVDWVLEAATLFGVLIPDREATQIKTVGAFVKHLRNAGASWGSDRAIKIEKGFLGSRHFELVQVPIPENATATKSSP